MVLTRTPWTHLLMGAVFQWDSTLLEHRPRPSSKRGQGVRSPITTSQGLRGMHTTPLGEELVGMGEAWLEVMTMTALPIVTLGKTGRTSTGAWLL